MLISWNIRKCISSCLIWHFDRSALRSLQSCPPTYTCSLILSSCASFSELMSRSGAGAIPCLPIVFSLSGQSLQHSPVPRLENPFRYVHSNVATGHCLSHIRWRKDWTKRYTPACLHLCFQESGRHRSCSYRANFYPLLWVWNQSFSSWLFCAFLNNSINALVIALDLLG